MRTEKETKIDVFAKEKGVKLRVIEVYEVLPQKIYWVYIETLDRLSDFINDIRGYEVGLNDEWSGIMIFAEKKGTAGEIDEERYAYVLFRGNWAFHFLSLCSRGYVHGFIVDSEYLYNHRIEKECKKVLEKWYDSSKKNKS